MVHECTRWRDRNDEIVSLALRRPALTKPDQLESHWESASMSNDKARILTVSELSEYLHVHRTTIYRMLREGNLPGFRIGSDWRLSLDAIEQWQRDHTN